MDLRFSAEDEEFREFVTTRRNALLRSAYLLTGDHGKAEDLVQTTLERTHRRWGRIQHRDSPERYARRVMINLTISTSRLKRFRERPLESAPEPRTADPCDRVAERDLLWSALQQLPAGMRAALVLRYYEDLSQEETASLLGCSVGTVKSQTSRGLASLRRVLGVTADVDQVPPATTPSGPDAPSTAPVTPPLHVRLATSEGGPR